MTQPPAQTPVEQAPASAQTRLFIEELANIDCAYLDPARGLVGESWLVDASLEGELDEQGMLVDFGPLKQTLRRVIERQVDHRLIIPGECGELTATQSGGYTAISRPLADGVLHYRAPDDAYFVLAADSVSPGRVADALAREAAAELPANVSRVQLRLYAPPAQGVTYHYCHGLRQHAGNCQRMGHGHRAGLEIRRDGERDTAAEQKWANRLDGVFIATRGDMVDAPVRAGRPHCRFAYEAKDGAFELMLPERRCYVIDRASTVECIAGHLARRLKNETPESRIAVKVYEGLHKGAEIAC